MLIAAFRGLCAILGFFILIVIFLWPDEKHRLHVWLEERWLHIDDRGHREQDRVDAFVGAIAQSISELYDRILGKRLFSERVIIVSFFVGFISSNIFFHIQTRVTPLDSSADDFLRFAAAIPLFVPLAVQAVFAVLLWLYVRYEREKSWIRILIRIVAIGVVLLNMAVAFVWRGWMSLLPTFSGFFLAVLVGVLVLAAIRLLIRQASHTDAAGPRALYLLGSVFLGSALLVLAMNSHFLHPAHQRSEVLYRAFGTAGFILMINGMSLLITCTLLLSAFLLLIYRIIWPTLSRITYVIPGDRLVFNNRLLVRLAVTLLGVALASLVYPTGQPDNTVCLSAELWGTVTTNGKPTDVWFEWGTTAALGRTTPHQIFDKDAKHRQSIINLDGGTVYYYRGVVANHLGRAYGQVRTFTTLTVPPGVKHAC